MSSLERNARRRWLANAAHSHYGGCDSCGRTRDAEGKPLYVARQSRRRKFECFDCFDALISDRISRRQYLETRPAAPPPSPHPLP